MKKSLYILIAVIVSLFLLYLSIFGFGSTINKDYSVSVKPDGGYVLNITIYKRYWKLITAEGIFPEKRVNFVINMVGKGRDWSFRNQEGYFYSSEEITTNIHDWDLGYAWVDSARNYLNLNLYWVRSPNRLIASDLNGRYSLNIR